jgi:hypothetical protein
MTREDKQVVYIWGGFIVFVLGSGVWAFWYYGLFS